MRTAFVRTPSGIKYHKNIRRSWRFPFRHDKIPLCDGCHKEKGPAFRKLLMAGHVWRALPVGTGHDLSSRVSGLSAAAVRVRRPPRVHSPFLLDFSSSTREHDFDRSCPNYLLVYAKSPGVMIRGLCFSV